MRTQIPPDATPTAEAPAAGAHTPTAQNHTNPHPIVRSQIPPDATPTPNVPTTDTLTLAVDDLSNPLFTAHTVPVQHGSDPQTTLSTLAPLSNPPNGLELMVDARTPTADTSSVHIDCTNSLRDCPICYHEFQASDGFTPPCPIPPGTNPHFICQRCFRRMCDINPATLSCPMCRHPIPHPHPAPPARIVYSASLAEEIYDLEFDGAPALPEPPLPIPGFRANFPLAADTEYVDEPYHERQQANMCGVHAINMLVGHPAVTTEQMIQFRRGQFPETLIVTSEVDAAHPFEHTDLIDDPTGNFTASVISVWLARHANAYLAAANQLLIPLDPTFSVASTLNNWAQQFGVSGFLVIARFSEGSHMFTVRHFRGQWMILDSIEEGPIPLLSRNPPFSVDGEYMFLYPRALPHPEIFGAPPGQPIVPIRTLHPPASFVAILTPETPPPPPLDSPSQPPSLSQPPAHAQLTPRPPPATNPFSTPSTSTRIPIRHTTITKRQPINNHKRRPNGTQHTNLVADHMAVNLTQRHILTDATPAQPSMEVIHSPMTHNFTTSMELDNTLMTHNTTLTTPSHLITTTNQGRRRLTAAAILTVRENLQPVPAIDPPLPNSSIPITTLPTPHTWIWTVWDVNGIRTSFFGLVISMTPKATRADTIFSDGTCHSLSLTALKRHNTHIVPNTSIPTSAREDVCGFLTPYLSTTAARSDPSRRIMQSIQSWSADEWHAMGLPPPQTQASPSEPPLAPPPPAHPLTLNTPIGSTGSTGRYILQRALDTARQFIPSFLRRRPEPDLPSPSEDTEMDIDPPQSNANGTKRARPNHTPDWCHTRAGAGPQRNKPWRHSRNTTQGLRIATHNVSGLSTAAIVHALVQTWHTANIDVVCLQETWIGRPGASGRAIPESDVCLWLRQATDTLHIPPYMPFWAHNTTLSDQNNGVAILIRPSAHITASGHIPSPCGRLQYLDITWAGHTFTLVNTYWPSTGPTDRARFIQSTLSPALTQISSPLCLLGDFNFTSFPALDRRPVTPSTAVADTATADLLAMAVPNHIDVFRHHHPSGKAFTFHRGTHLARLDRILLPAPLAAFTTSCALIYSPHGDHHAVTTHILPAKPLHPRGPGRRGLPSHNPQFAGVNDIIKEWADRAVHYGLSLSHEELLDWWPMLTKQYTHFMRNLHAHAGSKREEIESNLATASNNLQTTMDAVATADEAHLPAVIQTAVEARTTFRNLSRQAATPHAQHARDSWLSNREQPTPLTTALLSPPHAATCIPTIASPDGSLLTDNTDIANRMNSHYANISAERPTNPAAQEEILAALRHQLEIGYVRPIDLLAALSAGSSVFTHEEVKVALQSTFPGSAPGPDGIPYTMWRVCDDSWAPLLAKLFTAIGTLGRFPPNFHNGTITPIPKPEAADVTAPVSYRPITLLNTQYRILCKILASRYGAAMAPAIGPEHTAYLPGRRIEDNINFTSLLAHVMHAIDIPSATFFLDVSKAFDTVDREFMFRVMETMGASPGMVRWARLILTTTTSTTHVNGVESAPLTWHAGVRQGCPLSPLLYIFVAQSFASWLREHSHLGITLDTHRFVSSHFADDTQLHQQDLSPAALDTIPHILNTFSEASGQAINLNKSCVVLFGSPPAPPVPTTLAGVPVVPHTLSLGIPQSNPLPPPVPPPHSYPTRASQRPTPTPNVIPQCPLLATMWQKRTSKAIDRITRISRLPLSAMGRGIAISTYGLSTFLYHAEFCGLPPTLEDIQNLCASTIGRGISRNLFIGSPKLGGFGLLPVYAHVRARHAAMATRLIDALCRPPTDDANAQKPPLWTVLAEKLLMHACPHLHPAQTLLAATLASAVDASRGLIGPPSLPQPHRLPPGTLTHMASALQACGPLIAPNAHSVVDILTTPLQDPTLLSQLKWHHDDPAPFLPNPTLAPAASRLAVRDITEHLTAQTTSRVRFSRHCTYVRQALGPHSTAPFMPSLKSFLSTLQTIWRMEVPNTIKEVLWRLSVNAIPGCLVTPWHCPCHGPVHSPPTTGRQHSFWDCPVSVAVREQLDHALGSPVRQWEVWLLISPRPDLRKSIWHLVCLLALDAMEFGRRLLWAASHDHTCLRMPPGSPPTDVTPVVARLAVARFWSSLQDYVSDQSEGPSGLAPGHPFLSDQDGRLVVVLPQQAQLELP